ncbi:hypothetical protein [Psychroserpens damuponensis]|uniref:hypothetical protein n=1 Tax=Psychroserpens damuponensis TaxID=943936 RepID=UPI0006940AC3|nr:hypothetical protein [Psychroserpens damuponensis]
MKKPMSLIAIIYVLFLFSCGSNDDDCTKIITIPQTYFAGNQYYTYDITQEVSCDFPEPEDAVTIEPPRLENFTYEILFFTYTPDTGNNTSRLEFEIKLNNNNGYAVEGVPILTINSDGLVHTGSYSNNASVPCYSINANSSCILTFEAEDSLDLGASNTVELLNVEYFLTN